MIVTSNILVMQYLYIIAFEMCIRGYCMTLYDVIPSFITYRIVPTTAIFLISCYLRAQSTYIQATCSGVQPLVSVQVGLHFRSSMRYLARGRCPFLKLSINSKIELCKSHHYNIIIVITVLALIIQTAKNNY